jgi:hypothetical protein
MVLWCSFFGLAEAFAVNANDIIKLKNAGVSDRIIKKVAG